MSSLTSAEWSSERLTVFSGGDNDAAANEISRDYRSEPNHGVVDSLFDNKVCDM